MTSKVRIKAGAVEFEYEGQTELSIENIKELFSHIEALFNAAQTDADNDNAIDSNDFPNLPKQNESVPAPTTNFHVNSIAEKLDAKTGSDLAIAAAAYLQFSEGKETFSRRELLDTMKKATKFYKKNMSGNLTKILNHLLESKINQVGSGHYSLSQPEYSSLRLKLA